MLCSAVDKIDKHGSQITLKLHVVQFIAVSEKQETEKFKHTRFIKLLNNSRNI